MKCGDNMLYRGYNFSYFVLEIFVVERETGLEPATLSLEG